MTTKIQIRRDTAANWQSVNPKLLPGELGIEIDTLKIKIGPNISGGTNWNEITGYANIVANDLNSTLEDYILSAQVGASGGVVGLNNDANAVIPGNSIIIEGSDLNSYETTLVITEPTQDRTITIPDETGVLATRSYADSAASSAVASVIDAAPSALNTLNELAAALGDDANFSSTITNQLAGKQDKVTNVSSIEISYLDGVTSGIQSQIDSKLNLSGGTLTGHLTLHGDPTQSLHAATKQYVDNTTAGLNFHASAHAATVSNLSATYNNGSSGVGATLTSTSNAALIIDGHELLANERVLVKNQTTGSQNGIYVVTDSGSVSSPWILTRATDADNNPSGEVAYGDFIFIIHGTVNSGYGYILNTTGTVTLGTTSLSYVEFNAGKTVSAGYGLAENSPGEFEIDLEATADLSSLQRFTNKIINSSENSISIESSDVSDFDTSAKSAIGGALGNGLLFNGQTEIFSVDTTYVQTRVSNVSNTEIGYLNGVTESIQDQLNSKAPSDSPYLTGDSITDNLTVNGNLIVNGTNTILNTDTLQVEDNEIVLNSNVSGTPSTNAFLKVRRGVSNDVAISWNESTDKWQIDNVGGGAQNIASEQFTTQSISDHNSETINVHGIENTAELATKDYADNAVETHDLDSTNVHGIADTSLLATKQYADDAVSTHSLDTTNIHGISNTADLATKIYADDAVDTHNLQTTSVHGIADVDELATKTYADSSVNTHNLDGTNVHGIADTAELATKTYADNSSSSAVGNHNSDTTSVHGISDTAELATKTYANNAVDGHNSDTTSVHGIADTSALALTADVNDSLNLKQDKVSGVSDTEISYLDGVTSAIQTQLNAKASQSEFNDHTGDTTDVHGISDTSLLVTTTGTQTLSNKTINDPIINVGVGLGNITISNTEIGYLDGVSSNIQTQLNAKATPSDISDHNSDTTNVHGIADTSVLLTTAGGTVDALTISGDLIVQGTTTTTNTNSIEVSDALIYIASDNPGNALDIGFVGSFNNGTYQHTGFVRDVSDNKWKLFTGITDEPTTTVNFAQGSLDALAVGAFEASSAVIGDVSNTELQYLNGVTSAIQTQLDSKISSSTAASTYETISNVQLKAPIANPTFTGLVTLSSSGIAFTDGTQTKQGVPSQTYIYGAANSNAFTSNTTLSNLAYRDAMIEVESTSGVTITIPADSTTNFPVGTSIDILQTNTGQVTIAGDGFTPNATPGLKLRTRWSSCTLQKRGPNSWVVFGDLTA